MFADNRTTKDFNAKLEATNLHLLCFHFSFRHVFFVVDLKNTFDFIKPVNGFFLFKSINLFINTRKDQHVNDWSEKKKKK
jgi:hypothetical protein